MKRLAVVPLLTALLVLTAGFPALTQAQTLGADLKPTYLSSVPGLYVNGWPAFTLTYPKEWVEMPPIPAEVYRAGGTRPDLPPGVHLPIIGIGVIPNRLPLEEWAKALMPVWKQFATDIKVLYDKPSRLKDGAPAREVEFEYVLAWDPSLGRVENGPTRHTFILITKRESTLIFADLTDDREKIGEDLKKHAYSLAFQQSREEPVNVPPDVREFLVMCCADFVGGDVGSIMGHFSDRFFQWGTNKPMMEGWFRNDPSSPTQRGTMSCEVTVTVFGPQGERAYVDGFWLIKTKGDASAQKAPLNLRQIIKEQGQWKWYGNQK